jgi:fatty-acid peroxygenase
MDVDRRGGALPRTARILTRAAWAGVPLAEPEVGRRTKELTALSMPPATKAAMGSPRRDGPNDGSHRSDPRGQLGQPAESPLTVVALHRDLSGALLPARVAAVEV